MKTTKSNKRHAEYVAATKRVEVAELNFKKIHSEMQKLQEDFAIPGARTFAGKSEDLAELAEATKEIGVARDALLKILNK